MLANVGDSRAYLLRGWNTGGEMRQITEDHTYQHLIADAATVPNLPERLSRFVDGRPDDRSPDITTWQLSAGDRFMLCSDGLSSYVARESIDRVLRSSDRPSEAVDRLVSLALDHDGPDNITVIVMDVQDETQP